jgi:hypothetical protein
LALPPSVQHVVRQIPVAVEVAALRALVRQEEQASVLVEHAEALLVEGAREVQAAGGIEAA